VDTGTSLAIFPPVVAQSINTGLGLQPLPSDPRQYGLPCANGAMPQAPSLNLLFNGRFELTFEPRDYMHVINLQGRQFCVSGIIASGSNSNDIIMGNVLMRKYYWVFDAESLVIGYALANRLPGLWQTRYIHGTYRSYPQGINP
jgi:hypothetical protein